jgi:hypothetical protein
MQTDEPSQWRRDNLDDAGGQDFMLIAQGNQQRSSNRRRAARRELFASGRAKERRSNSHFCQLKELYGWSA